MSDKSILDEILSYAKRMEQTNSQLASICSFLKDECEALKEEIGVKNRLIEKLRNGKLQEEDKPIEIKKRGRPRKDEGDKQHIQNS